YKGAETAGNNLVDDNNQGASYLVEECSRSKVTLLAIGPLTNLKQAFYKDSSFFDNIDEIVLMGGVTEPLILGGKQLDELNFSEDPAAAGLVLNAPVPVTVMTGNLCLQLFFGESELEILKSTSIPIYKYIYKQIVDWFFYSEKLVGKKGFYMWDLAAALYLTHKGHFDDNYVKITSNIEKLKKGYIEFEGVHNEEVNLRQEGIVNLPTRISEVNLLKKEIFKSWAQVSMEEF
ncbi:MAG: nucleoside hydrolase, partial [Halanaerobiales bacterium]